MLFGDRIFTPGRRPSAQNAAGAYSHDLTKEDVEAYLEPRERQPAQAITKIRQRHHALARALAMGMTQVEAARVVGFTPERVHVLMLDPALNELISFYQSQVDAAQIDLVERMAALATDAVIVLHERLEENPESFDNEELLSVVKTTADRSGFGPSSKTTNVNVNVNLADRLAEARRRSQPKLIEGDK